MSSPYNRRHSSPDWHKLPALFNEWKEVIGAVAAALATALTVIGVKAQGTAQVIGYAVVLLVLGGGGYLGYRAKRRREIAWHRTQLQETLEKRKQHRTAFRGLYPYQEGETLPGHQRKREAQIIFTQVTDASFSFGVLCGDSGCGKTSLLRCALQACLKEAEMETGLRALYIRSPRELIGDLDESDGLTEADRLRRQISVLKHLATQASGGAPLVIIIDQFEEFFIGYKSYMRGQLGSDLNELIHATPPSRILCAVRSEYLKDMRDLAPQLPEPISITTLFTINNFTIEQSADVILECAALDGVELDPALPSALAEDLAEGEFIRPTELQIVCTALVSNPTIAEYRLRGGAQGILSHHIQSAITICADPNLGSQILRALCDFPTHAKCTPQTASEILSALELTAGLGREQAVKTVTDILAQFEAARLVLVDTRGAEATYALVHDYVVDAVYAATSNDAMNRREKANQLLQYYVAEHRADPKTKMPLRRRRFISRYADKALLAEPRARQLFKASRNAFIINLAALLMLVVISTAVLLTALNTHRTWESKEINQLLPDVKKNQIVAAYDYRLPDSARVITLAYTPEACYARLWDSKTATVLWEVKADDFILDEGIRFMVGMDKEAHSVYALHLETGEKYPLPVSAAVIDRTDLRDLIIFGASGAVVMISQVAEGDKKTLQDRGVQIWSILEKKELGRVKPIAWWRDYRLYLDKSESRLIGSSWVQEQPGKYRWFWGLWDARTGKLITELAKGDEAVRFATDDSSNKLVLVMKGEDQQLVVQLYDLREGRLLRKESLLDKEPKDPNEDLDVAILGQGDLIALTSIPQSGFGKLLAVLSTSDLLPAPQYARNDLQWVYGPYNNGRLAKVCWASNEGTYVLDMTGKPLHLLQGLTLQPPSKEDGIWRERVFIDKQETRAIVPRRDGRIEMYDLNNGRKFHEINLTGLKEGFSFTYDDRVLDMTSADGRHLFYSLENGDKLLELSNIGDQVIFYDVKCKQVNVWFHDGSVQRYAEGIKILGSWFWPTPTCRN